MDFFKKTDKIITDFERVVKNPIIPANKEKLLVGVDFGTAYIVVTVLDENKNPVAGAYRFAQVVKDGIVLDYIGAINIVKALKREIEDKIGCKLSCTAVAIPPGTTVNDTRFIKSAAEGAGFEVTNVVDEPTAANSVLEIKNGVVVDIGGGTTGLAVFRDGEVVHISDEPTGGTHCTLVIAGAYKVSFEEAEKLKKDPDKQLEISTVLNPVVEKIACIISKNIKNYDVDAIYLVGGTSCMLNIEKVIENITGIKTYKPKNPLFITPVGIAMNCMDV
ncbi:MAG: ethanolamine utilization protein EutJ [Sedimentibacter sp.]